MGDILKRAVVVFTSDDSILGKTSPRKSSCATTGRSTTSDSMAEEIVQESTRPV